MTDLDVHFNPAPEYIFSYLTADVQTLECMFDLIDNSIDAARKLIREKDNTAALLPDDYSGYKIDVSLTPELVVICDNCSGISEERFTKSAFRAGETSEQPYGIGHFGVGLKRAILKIGDKCTVETDDGNAKLTLAFTRSQLDNANELKLPASKQDTTGKTYTTISIEDIKADTKRDMSSLTWNKILLRNISRRYGLFVRKGLVITVNGSTVASFAPQPVENEHIKIQTFNAQIHGVEVEIVAGVHEKYRFGINSKGELGADPSNRAVHKEIANEFGWYVVCNDRVILLHDTSYKTGWTTNWHSEYSGFVGWIHFVSKNPSHLPWNTRKSDIVENSEVYEEIIPILQEIAGTYRKTTPLAKRSGKGNSKQVTKAKEQQQRSATLKQILAGKANRAQLKSIPTLLPQNIAYVSKLPKLAGLVDECQRLEIESFPYASAVIFRTVFDTALRDYLKRHGHFIAMRNAVLDEKMKPETLISDTERRSFSPQLSDMVSWCSKNIHVFPDPFGRDCRIACQRFAHHLPVINGVVHEGAGISNYGQIRTMRDEVLQGLLHMLGS
jgi:hypothetical protein